MSNRIKGRVDVDLSAALVDYEVQVNAQQIVVRSMPAGVSFSVKLGATNEPEIPVENIGVLVCCDEPIDRIFISCDAQSGEAVLIFADANLVFDFLAPSAAAEPAWVPTFGIVCRADTSAIDPIYSTTVPGALGGAKGYIDDVRQVHGLRAGLIGGGSSYIRQDQGEGFTLGHLAPGGSTRRRKSGVQHKITGRVMAYLAGAPAGQRAGIFGFYDDSAGNPFGVGFAYGNAEANWRCVVTDDDMIFANWPHTSPLVNVDTGIAKTAEFFDAEMVWGDDGAGEGFLEWWVNGVLIHRITTLPSWPTWGTLPRFGIFAYNTAALDENRLITDGGIYRYQRSVTLL